MDNISSAIFKIEQALSDKLCDNLSEYIELSCKQKATLLSNDKEIEDTAYRNVYNYGLDERKDQDMLYKKIIFDCCQKAIQKYQKIFPALHQEMKLESINLLKYEVGNFYRRHIDAYHQVNRHLSFIINLNENYEGGELMFYYPHNHQAYSKVNLKKGDLIMFPSNFMYPHSVERIKQGTRYSIVSWFS
tara:strand:+ start:185 stop:751 length:567 start_codon:yes stop_codon:yes gene_type:complete